MEYLLEIALATVVSLWVGSFLSSYMKKKGENLATHEDVDKLVAQMAAITQATKEIEAKISGDAWNRQKRWEMKKEVLFEAAKRIAQLDDGLLALDSLLRVDSPNDDKWLEWRHKAVAGWNETTKRFDETRELIGIVCDKQAYEAFGNLAMVVTKVGASLVKHDAAVYRESAKEVYKMMIGARGAIRKALEIDESAAPESRQLPKSSVPITRSLTSD